MKIKLILLLLLISILHACITPIEDFEQVNFKSFIAIEAELSNEVKEHVVRLSITSDRLGLKGLEQQPLSGAIVFFTDEKGKIENLIENENQLGYYNTSKTFAGKIGSTYILTVKTPDGKVFESTPELIRQVPDIKGIKSYFNTKSNYPKGDFRRNGFIVTINLDDKPASGDYFQWLWKHYEKARTCETCGGYIGNDKFGANYDFNTYECAFRSPFYPFERPAKINYKCQENCWNITYSIDLNIISDALLAGKGLVGKQIARIPFDSTSAYYIRIEQRAISPATFVYLKTLSEQVQNSGTLFDVPAETIFNSNVKCLTDKNEKVLGIFSAYGVKTKVEYIDRSIGVPPDEKPILQEEVDYFKCPKEGAFDCKDIAKCFENNARTKFKPEGWLDKP